ncbi:hypothetical protein OIV83_003861 [Microbotryomycetes sp. JL201]|nr:hypothetical protein OIV83_003861 [Microbotryomycetes sp. JL201]
MQKINGQDVFVAMATYPSGQSKSKNKKRSNQSKTTRPDQPRPPADRAQDKKARGPVEVPPRLPVELISHILRQEWEETGSFLGTGRREACCTKWKQPHQAWLHSFSINLGGASREELAYFRKHVLPACAPYVRTFRYHGAYNMNPFGRAPFRRKHQDELSREIEEKLRSCSDFDLGQQYWCTEYVKQLKNILLSLPNVTELEVQLPMVSDSPFGDDVSDRTQINPSVTDDIPWDPIDMSKQFISISVTLFEVVWNLEHLFVDFGNIGPQFVHFKLNVPRFNNLRYVSLGGIATPKDDGDAHTLLPFLGSRFLPLLERLELDYLDLSRAADVKSWPDRLKHLHVHFTGIRQTTLRLWLSQLCDTLKVLQLSCQQRDVDQAVQQVDLLKGQPRIRMRALTRLYLALGRSVWSQFLEPIIVTDAEPEFPPED